MKLLYSAAGEETVINVWRLARAALAEPFYREILPTYCIVPYWNFNLATQTIDPLVPAGALGQFHF